MAQCKTKADLHREYARTIDMCEGTKIKPWQCVKCNSAKFTFQPAFSKDASDYSFALAIVEGKPVFPGDLLYNKDDGLKYKVDSACNLNEIFWSWEPPQPKKLVLNDVELPMPCDGSTVHVTIPFDNIDLANQFRKQFFNLVANQKDSK